jgi:hypothetical protein
MKQVSLCFVLKNKESGSSYNWRGNLGYTLLKIGTFRFSERELLTCVFKNVFKN